MRNQEIYRNTTEPNAAHGVHSTASAFIRGRLIDIGCGAGWFDADTNIDVFERNLIDFHKLDMSKDHIPKKDKSYDTALLIEVLERLENPWHAIREAKRLAKRVIITTPENEDLTNKLIYLRHGRFAYFGHDFDHHHQTPIFRWQLNRMRGDWKLVYETIVNGVLIQVWDE